MKNDDAVKTIEEILLKAGFKIKSVTVEQIDEKEIYINISSESDLGILIGKKGEFLAALQCVIKNVFKNKQISDENENIKIDVDNYRKKQEENVIEMAYKRAKYVEDTGRDSVLPPMSPYFRRMVHLHVKEKFPKLNTFSRGTGSFRAVCISTENNAPEGKSSGDLYEDLDL